MRIGVLLVIVLAGCAPARYNNVAPVPVDIGKRDYDVQIVDDGHGGLSAWVEPASSFQLIADTDWNGVNREIVEAALAAARPLCEDDPAVVMTSKSAEVYAISEVHMSCSRKRVE